MYFEKGNWLIELKEQWSQFFRRDNWYTFTPILLEFEDDRCMGGVEFTIIVLGLGIRVSWMYNPEAEKRVEIRKIMADLETDSEGTIISSLDR